MKKLVKTVKLSFFQDETTGEFGLTHTNTLDKGFNAFFDGKGIFHDVFEHNQELENKYFQGDYAFNVGGEMFAMGAMWYYYNQIGLYGVRELNTYKPFCESMRYTTESMLIESIHTGYCDFGYTLESNVPKQSPVYDDELEYQIKQMWENVKKLQPYTDCHERADALEYKKSVTFGKIANLHRYGFKQAELLVPDNFENQETLVNFIKFWDKFCTLNNAEELDSIFSGITFKLYKEKGVLTWTATLVSRYREYKDLKLTENSHAFVEVDELYTEQD